MKLVKIVMTNGDEFYVKMCVSQECTKILSTDAHSHHAWQGTSGRVRTKQVQKFRDKFGIKTPSQ